MIEQQQYLGFDCLVMTEAKTNSKAILCPERGGILIQLTLEGEEVFYLQEDTFSDATKNIRGGNPILFPTCGPLPNNEYILDGKTYSLKQHGFARNKVWAVESTESTEESIKVTLRLEDDEETRELYPFSFRLLFTYELKDGKLSLYQTYENLSNRTMPFYAGFHPYFLGDHYSATYDIPSTHYLDAEDGKVKERKQPINELEIADTKIFLELSKPTSSITFKNHTICLSYSEHFSYGLVWSERASEYVCLEPWMAGPGTFTNNKGVIQLAAGQQLQAECAFFIKK
ncbi:hypothetical protein [Bacillus massiliigorillae]|uniref:aldose epimerase family protein n=1 Tax=Bacillus massiliigorillae TaxID=1243664 RepID=UPI0003A8FA40|nr:hypothetical protein [Bacillus massiliigorillae]